MLTKDSSLTNNQHFQLSPRREETTFPWSSGFLAPTFSRYNISNIPYFSQRFYQMEQKDMYKNSLNKAHLSPISVKKELSPEHLSGSQNNHQYSENLIKQEIDIKEASFDSLKKMMQRFGPTEMSEYQRFENNNSFNQHPNENQALQQQNLFYNQQKNFFHSQQLQLQKKRPPWSDNSISPLMYNPLVSQINPILFSKTLDSAYNSKKFNFPTKFPKSTGFEEETFNSSGENAIQDEETKLFPCRNCSFISSSKEEFEQHSRKHFKYSCSLCNYKSKSEGRLKRHLKHSHENNENTITDLTENGNDSVNNSLIEDISNDSKSVYKETTNCESVEQTDDKTSKQIRPNAAENSKDFSFPQNLFQKNECSNNESEFNEANNEKSNVQNIYQNSVGESVISDSPEKNNFKNNKNNFIANAVKTTDMKVDSTNDKKTTKNNDNASVGLNTKGGQNEDQSSNKKLSKARVCKICGYVTYDKNDNYQHRSTHFPNMLKCDVAGCKFATQHRHHFLYHMKGHKGEKSYKCNKCNYSCLTRSMLVSHEKCHSYVYRYRCSTCKFSAKHAHALTVHIVKWNHEPAPVLRPDGSLPINDPSSNFENYVRKGRRNRQIMKNHMPIPAQFSPINKEPENGMAKFPSVYNTGNTNSSNSIQNVQQLQNSAYYQNLMAHRNMLLNIDLSKAPPIPRNLFPFSFPHSSSNKFPFFKPMQQGSNVKCLQCKQSFENPIAYMNHAFKGNCVEPFQNNLKRSFTPEDSESEENSITSNRFDQSNGEEDLEKEDHGIFDSEYKKEKVHEDYREKNLSNGNKPCNALDLSAKKSRQSDEDDEEIKKVMMEKKEMDEKESNDGQLFDKHQDNAAIKSTTESINSDDMQLNKSVIGTEIKLDNTSSPPLVICSEQTASAISRKSRRKGIAHKITLNDDENKEVTNDKGEKKPDFNGKDDALEHEKMDENADENQNKKESDTKLDENNHDSLKYIPPKIYQENLEPLLKRSHAKINTIKPSIDSSKDNFQAPDPSYYCKHCRIAFGDKRIYDIHMQFHKPGEPFTCQLCCREYFNGREFFLHVAQFEHNFKATPSL